MNGEKFSCGDNFKQLKHTISLEERENYWDLNFSK